VTRLVLLVGGLIALAATSASRAGQPATAPAAPRFVVRFHEPRTEGTPQAAPVDPAVHIRIAHSGRMMFGLTADQNLTLTTGNSIRTSFRLDEQVLQPVSGPAGPLPVAPGGKRRTGGLSSWTTNNVQFTQWLEVVPTKASLGEKRRLDAVLIQYLIDNKSTLPHKVGVRVRIDTMCAGNDGALFAAPTTHPGKVLDGVELREATLPDFVQILQRPDVKNPGMVGHFALKLGSKIAAPDRFVCTGHAAADNGWMVTVQPANNDSDAVLYWEPRVIPPGGQLSVGFGYGKGLATLPEGEGRLSLRLGGSFEPNKLSTISAYVDDPLPNQTLALELPEGLELVEGKAIQPVPAATDTSLVLWKARVRALGTHAVVIRSSTGISETRTFTVAKE
jgi:hypothetical protein